MMSLSDLVFLRLPNRTTFAVLAMVTAGASAHLEPTGEFLQIENGGLEVGVTHSIWNPLPKCVRRVCAARLTTRPLALVA